MKAKPIFTLLISPHHSLTTLQNLTHLLTLCRRSASPGRTVPRNSPTCRIPGCPRVGWPYCAFHQCPGCEQPKRSFAPTCGAPACRRRLSGFYRLVDFGTQTD